MRYFEPVHLYHVRKEKDKRKPLGAQHAGPRNEPSKALALRPTETYVSGYVAGSATGPATPLGDLEWPGINFGSRR